MNIPHTMIFSADADLISKNFYFYLAVADILSKNRECLPFAML